MSRWVANWKNDRSGAGAVEFALVAPLLFAFLFGIIFYSSLFTVMSGVQQLAAEAARAAMAGLSASERDQIARGFVQANAGAYPLIDTTKLTVTTATSSTSSQFQVSLTYDLSGLSVFKIGSLITPTLGSMQRSAVVGLSS